MDRLEAMRVFAQVVESGSFARAAERLDLSTSAVSRHVADLETHLAARLLQRTTRRISLTESGRMFYERCVQLLADLDEAEQEVTRSVAAPRGTIRLTTSINFGMRHVTPAIAAFVNRYPEVKFDVSLSDRLVDLVEEGFDLAIRIGGPGAGHLVARRLAETHLVTAASPDYLARRGTPQTPADLAGHNCLTYEYHGERDRWRLHDAAGREHVVQVAGSVHSNNGDLLAEAAAQGIGVICEPAFIVGPEIRAGRLVPILADYRSSPLAIYAVYPSRKHLSAKVRAFVDFLAERYAGAADFECVQ
jgi:DNA-binding transcriptional LysR family regulator